MSDALWIILTACLVAVVCALPGTLLMLRRQALLGDAISHAVLPGIFLAYFAGAGQSPVALLPGAAFSGWLAAQWIGWLSTRRFLSSDSATGLVFTFLFAIGVILISAFAGQTDLDQDCVLFGDIIWVPLERWSTATGIDLGPVSFWILMVTLVLFLFLLVMGFSYWKFSTFDPVSAAASGISLVFWQSLLMGMVSLSSVVSFRAVGAVLVIAFLSVPPAIASLYCKSLRALLIHSCFWACVAVISGWFVADTLNVSVSGTMAVMCGIWFLLVYAGTLLKQKV